MKSKQTIFKLYDEYVEQEIKITRKYKELSNKFIIEREEFIKGLTKERQEKFDKIIDIVLDMNIADSKNIFAEGYILGSKLTTEVLYDEKKGK